MIYIQYNLNSLPLFDQSNFGIMKGLGNTSMEAYEETINAIDFYTSKTFGNKQGGKLRVFTCSYTCIYTKWKSFSFLQHFYDKNATCNIKK